MHAVSTLINWKGNGELNTALESGFLWFWKLTQTVSEMPVLLLIAVFIALMMLDELIRLHIKFFIAKFGLNTTRWGKAIGVSSYAILFVCNTAFGVLVLIHMTMQITM